MSAHFGWMLVALVVVAVIIVGVLAVRHDRPRVPKWARWLGPVEDDPTRCQRCGKPSDAGRLCAKCRETIDDGRQTPGWQ